MDVDSQTREISIEKWWRTSVNDTDQYLMGNGPFGASLSPATNMSAAEEMRNQVMQQMSAQGSNIPVQERQSYGSSSDVHNPYDSMAYGEYRTEELAAGRLPALPATAFPTRLPRAIHNSQRSTIASSVRTNLGHASSRFREGENLERFRYHASMPGHQGHDSRRPQSETFPYGMRHQQEPLLRNTQFEGSTLSEENNMTCRYDTWPNLFAENGIWPNSPSRRPSVPSNISPRECEFVSDDDDLSEPDFALRSNTALGTFQSNLMAEEERLMFEKRARASGSAARANTNLMNAAANNQTFMSITANLPPQNLSTNPPWTVVAEVDRKRRRNDGSPQEAVPPPPVPGIVGAPRTSARRATSAAAGPPIRSQLRAQAPVFVPQGARASFLLERHNFGLDQALPENVRLKIDRHLNQDTIFPVPRTSTAVFLPIHIGMRHLVFASELIPPCFGKRDRRTLLHIFRTEAPYVPACITSVRPKIQYHHFLKRQHHITFPYKRSSDPPLNQRGQGWPVAPNGGLPLEVFQNIARYLPRIALESMRLVNHEFERKISNIQFKKVVVPFRPEIYDIIDPRGPLLKNTDVKGKGKEKESSFEPDNTAKAVHDGMKVFEAWGSEVREFAMAFEVPDDQLARPPVKSKFEVFDTFFGSYHWPHPDYRRFELLCDLEKIADEHRYMSRALSSLQAVRVLGLCIDNGLGWLSGPDISDHAQVFKQKTAIFGARDSEMKSIHEESERLWKEIIRSLRPEDGVDYRVDGDFIYHGDVPMPRNEHGFYEALVNPPGQTPRLEFLHKADTVIRPLIYQGIDVENPQSGLPDVPPVNLLDLSQASTESSSFTNAPVVPKKLTVPQKEWLMETEWAQRAFLSSYCMALTDNSLTFQHVHTFNIAKLPSRHMGALERDDFWAALPNVTNVVLNVAPDFRAVSKNSSGEVVTDDIEPSEAATQFFRLLMRYVSRVKSISKLSLGYCGGGERQTGIFGRNKLILPAPLADYTSQNVFDRSFRGILSLPHVQHLTLTNCWIAPPTLKGFASASRGAKLETLTLDSVSLSAHTSVPDPVLPDPLHNGVFASPIGQPLRLSRDPHLGSFFTQRDSYGNPADTDPLPGNLDTWVCTPDRIGSWPEVIDSITPGPTLDLIRYAFRYLEDPPPQRNNGSLLTINFNSCGYVRLINVPSEILDQSALPGVVNDPPYWLRKRAMDLMPVMMHRNSDQLLGQIAPALPDFDTSVFATGFPMRIGWEGEEGFDAVEDGQPMGGDGRFSGRVERLRF